MQSISAIGLDIARSVIQVPSGHTPSAEVPAGGLRFNLIQAAQPISTKPFLHGLMRTSAGPVANTILAIRPFQNAGLAP